MSSNGPVTRTVTIPNGQTTSDAEPLARLTLLGLITPVSGLAATSFSFLVSMDNVRFMPLYDSSTGTLLTLTVTNDAAYAIDPILFLPWKWMKVVSNTSESGGDTITLSVRPVA